MNNNFKPDALNKKPIEAKTPEYSFNEGVDICVARIQELLKTLDRDVFVVISGSRIDVGKTILLGTIQKKLISLGIKNYHTSPVNVRDRTQKVIFDTEQGQLYPAGRNYRDDVIGRNPDLRIGEIADLYVGIYRPDKPFSGRGEGKESPVADIMIRNEYAKDKRK